MIDWNKSAKLNNITVDDLKEYFDRFPGSHKRIIAICECDCCEHKEREISFGAYTDLCRSCSQKKSHRTTESKAIQSKASNKMYYDDPTIKERISSGLKRIHKIDPTIAQRMSESHKKRYEDPEERRKTGEAGKIARDKDPDIVRRQMISIKKTHNDHPELWKTEAMKHSSDKQRGGNDIVRHHYIYDHNDLSKYTTKMTRSKHTKIHRAMQKIGIQIPHINR